MKYNVYKLESTNAVMLVSALECAKGFIATRTQEIFNNLLSNEIENLIDNICLNIIPDPEGRIIDIAYDNLIQKIETASRNNFATEYNLNATANVYVHNKKAYIEIVTMQDDLFKAAEKVKAFRNYSCVEQGDEVNDQKRAELNEVIKAYAKRKPLTYSLTYYNVSKPKFEDLHFNETSVRIQKRARYQLTNQYLGMYSGGKEIPPYKLMEYLDEALLKLNDDKSREMLDEYEMALSKIITPITKEIVEN